jgi:hypothetical protein
MKIVNRGYMIVKPTAKFIQWAQSIDENCMLDEQTAEGNVYLIEEEFLEEEPILLKSFKKIFANEMMCFTEEEEEWPGKVDMENFRELFTVEFGSVVFDLQKTDLKRD